MAMLQKHILSMNYMNKWMLILFSSAKGLQS